MESLFTAEPPKGSTAWRMVQESLQEGRKEGAERNNYEITVNMINEGLSNELISRINGLSIERINEIRKEIDANK